MMEKPMNIISVCIFACFFIFIPPLYPGQTFEKGRVIEKVVCQYDRMQSYALFLPTAYSPEKQWPIIYAFDPGARGNIPVELFHQAAEKCGYIIAGSNNSQNGPWDNNVRAANALWSDTHIHFSIDDKRIYSAGFSGGARMASGLSHLLKKPVAGIIACGAGLPNWLNPDMIAPAVFFGVAGLADMNYKELKRLDMEFDSLDTAHRIRIFDGPHDWPPMELCEEAVEWMELQAIEAGKKEKDSAFLQRLYEKGLGRAANYEDSSNTHEAFQVYRGLKDDFSGMLDISRAEAKASQIESDPDFKKKQEQEKQALEEELILMKDLKEKFWKLKKNIDEPFEREKLLRSFHLDRLLEKADKEEDKFQSMMAKRLLQDFSHNLYEQGEISFEAKDYSTAAVIFELVAKSSSRHPQVLYKLASAYSLNDQKEKALQTLKEAVVQGFSDAARLEKDKNFDPIRGEDEFEALLDLLKKNLR